MAVCVYYPPTYTVHVSRQLVCAPLPYLPRILPFPAGSQTVLRITRTALDVFSVSNRLDVYVLQDISSTGEEAIFYLK